MYGYGYGHGMSAWGWFAMFSGTVLVWALLVVLAVVLYRMGTAQHRVGTAPLSGTAGDRDAERILAERFARGEIDESEYRSRLSVLRSGNG